VALAREARNQERKQGAYVAVMAHVDWVIADVTFEFGRIRPSSHSPRIIPMKPETNDKVQALASLVLSDEVGAG
jgi:hypothetical protein